MDTTPLIVVDFGSKYTKWIDYSLKRLRIPFIKIIALKEKPEGHQIFNQIKATPNSGIILSGSHDNLYESSARRLPKEFISYINQNNIPTLGICYGHQLLALLTGGSIIKNSKGLEKGHFTFTQTESGFPLFKGLPCKFKVKMHHFDIIETLPFMFHNFGKTQKTQFAAIQLIHGRTALPIYGIQLHPERSFHRVRYAIFNNFYEICLDNSRK